MSQSKLGVIFAVVFIDFLGLSFILPLYPELSDRFGLSATLITLLATSYALMQFIFSPILGRLSDRFGRKRLLLLSTLGTAFSFVLFGLAQTPWLLFVSRIFNGITGSSTAVAQAYIADVTPKEERARGMGLVGAALGLGLILGPAMSGLLGRLGFGVPALAAAGVSVVNSFLIFFFLEESLKKESPSDFKSLVPQFSFKRFFEILGHPIMANLLIIYFLNTFAFAALQNVAGLFTKERFHFTLEENGYLYAYIGLLLVLVQGLLVGKLSKKIGESLVVILGFVLLMFGFILVPVTQQVLAVIFVTTVLAFGAGVSTPALNALISKNSSAHEQGGIFGIAQGLGGLALIGGPVFAGFLFDVLGSGSPFFASAIIVLAALYFALRVFRRLQTIEKRTFFWHSP